MPESSTPLDDVVLDTDASFEEMSAETVVNTNRSPSPPPLLHAAAAATARLVPTVIARSGGRRVLTLIYDKGLGAMRAVDRLIP